MIVVTIHLHSAITKEVTQIGQMVIANDGSSNDERIGNYIFGIKNKTVRKLTPVSEDCSRVNHVRGYKRKSQVVWELVKMCLNKAYPEK